MGAGYGEQMAKSIKDMGAGKMEFYKRFLERSKRHGYGEFKVPILQAIISGLKGEAGVHFKDSFFAAPAGNTGKVECWDCHGNDSGSGKKNSRQRGGLASRNFVCPRATIIASSN